MTILEYGKHYLHTDGKTYYKPMLVECECGEELNVYTEVTNQCYCGRLYKGSGASIAAREAQGDDTD